MLGTIGKQVVTDIVSRMMITETNHMSVGRVIVQKTASYPENASTVIAREFNLIYLVIIDSRMLSAVVALAALGEVMTCLNGATIQIVKLQ
jgi:hypothetical protein